MPRHLPIVYTAVKRAILAGSHAIKLPRISLLSVHIVKHHNARHISPRDVGAVVNEYWKLALLRRIFVKHRHLFVGDDFRTSPCDQLGSAPLPLDGAGGARGHDFQLRGQIGDGIGRLGGLSGLKSHLGLDECPLQVFLFLLHII